MRLKLRPAMRATQISPAPRRPCAKWVCPTAAVIFARRPGSGKVWNEVAQKMGTLLKLAWGAKSPIRIPYIRNWARNTHAPLLAVVLLAGFTGVNCSTGGTETVEAVLVAPPNVPPRVNRDAAHVIVNLEAREEVHEIAPGVEYRVWSFNGSVPGPLIRVRVGDTVEIRLRNRSENTMLHNIDLHAVNGPGGGAEATNVAPGGGRKPSRSRRRVAWSVRVPLRGRANRGRHNSNGMYGRHLVDGLTAGQPSIESSRGPHEYYLSDTPGRRGIAAGLTKCMPKIPTYVVFNVRPSAPGRRCPAGEHGRDRP